MTNIVTKQSAVLQKLCYKEVLMTWENPYSIIWCEKYRLEEKGYVQELNQVTQYAQDENVPKCAESLPVIFNLSLFFSPVYSKLSCIIYRACIIYTA